MGVVLPAEADAALVHRDQPAVADGDAVGVARQVLEHLSGRAKGRLGVDDPLASHGGVQQPFQGIVMVDAPQRLAAVRPLEPVDELAAEHAREHTHRQEEAGSA